MDIIEKLYTWSSIKMTERFNQNHSLCKCPYCMQYAETGQEQFAAWTKWDKDNDYIVLTCGPCGGTSLWVEVFHMFPDMIYVCPLDPPKGKMKMDAQLIPADLKKKMALEALKQ